MIAAAPIYAVAAVQMLFTGAERFVVAGDLAGYGAGLRGLPAGVVLAVKVAWGRSQRNSLLSRADLPTSR